MPAIAVLARYRPEELPVLQAFVEAAGLFAKPCDRLGECDVGAGVAIFSTAVPGEAKPNEVLNNHQEYFQKVVADYREAHPKTPIVLFSQLPAATVVEFLKPKFEGQPVIGLPVSRDTLSAPGLGQPFSFVVLHRDDLDPKKDEVQYTMAIELLKRLTL